MINYNDDNLFVQEKNNLPLFEPELDNCVNFSNSTIQTFKHIIKDSLLNALTECKINFIPLLETLNNLNLVIEKKVSNEKTSNILINNNNNSIITYQNINDNSNNDKFDNLDIDIDIGYNEDNYLDNDNISYFSENEDDDSI